MKKKVYSLAANCVTALFAATMLTACLSDGDDTIVLEDGTYTGGIQEGQDETQVVSTSESKTFTRAGFILTVPYGAVPKNTSGDDGRVAFSVSRVEELPASLPAGSTLVNNASIKIEPMNFVFTSPLTMKIPAQGYDADELQLLHYNEYTNSWENVPFSTINSDGTISVSIIELGYFVLVKKPTSQQQMGGVHIAQRYLSEDYFYYLTLIPSSGQTDGLKRIAFAANGEDIYMGNIPLGEYSVIISREQRNSLDNASLKSEYNTESILVNVINVLTAGNGDYSTYTGWTEIELGNRWTTGRTDAWGDVTATYGTGKFQATLTWVNSGNNATDYDLHLFGPSNMHVYFSDKTSESFELDRDWLTGSGNAVENIYSINDTFTPGTYTVKVHHYSGVFGKRYNCRVIVDGVVVKSVSGSITTDNAFDEIYSFNIE